MNRQHMVTFFQCVLVSAIFALLSLGFRITVIEESERIALLEQALTETVMNDPNAVESEVPVINPFRLRNITFGLSNPWVWGMYMRVYLPTFAMFLVATVLVSVWNRRRDGT